MTILRGLIAGLMIAVIAILAQDNSPEWAFLPAIVLYLAIAGDWQTVKSRWRRRG